LVEIRDRDGLVVWLQDQPREVSVAIAVRAALRVLPLLAADVHENAPSAL